MNYETQLRMVYKVLKRIQQPEPGTPGEPLLLSISVLDSFTCIHNTHANGFTSHPKDGAMVVPVDTSVTSAGDSNPHSADQKRQSLNLLLLTARPRHFQEHRQCNSICLLLTFALDQTFFIRTTFVQLY
jgi:hypothetical protein